METFGQIGNEFINLYSEENPILETDDICYFLFFNVDDYHRPLVGRGVILEDRFVESLNKEYYILIEDICENIIDINKYIIKHQFICHPLESSGKINGRKMCTILRTSDFSKYVMKIECFFVRKTLTQIQQLQKEFAKIIYNDLKQQMHDISKLIDIEQ